MTSTDLHCLELIKTCALASSRLTTTGAKCAVCAGRVNYSMLTAQSTNCTTCAVLIAYCELFNFKRLKECKRVANALPSTYLHKLVNQLTCLNLESEMVRDLNEVQHYTQAQVLKVLPEQKVSKAQLNISRKRYNLNINKRWSSSNVT